MPRYRIVIESEDLVQVAMETHGLAPDVTEAMLYRALQAVRRILDAKARVQEQLKGVVVSRHIPRGHGNG